MGLGVVHPFGERCRTRANLLGHGRHHRAPQKARNGCDHHGHDEKAHNLYTEEKLWRLHANVGDHHEGGTEDGCRDHLRAGVGHLDLGLEAGPWLDLLAVGLHDHIGHEGHKGNHHHVGHDVKGQEDLWVHHGEHHVNQGNWGHGQKGDELLLNEAGLNHGALHP